MELGAGAEADRVHGLRARCSAGRCERCSSRSLVLVGELVLPCGLLRNGLQAGSALGVGAGGAERLSSFSQLAGEGSVVDLLQVLLDFAPGVFQELCLTLECGGAQMLEL